MWLHRRCVFTGEGIHDGYDKIHLYDAYGFSESADVEPGNEPFAFDVDGITVGDTTCHDVRFPELFRKLADRGAQAIIVTAHWGAGEGKVDAWIFVGCEWSGGSFSWFGQRCCCVLLYGGERLELYDLGSNPCGHPCRVLRAGYMRIPDTCICIGFLAAALRADGVAVGDRLACGRFIWRGRADRGGQSRPGARG